MRIPFGTGGWMKIVLILAGVAAALAALECGNQYLSIKSDLSAQRQAARDAWPGVGEAMECRAALISRLASGPGLGEGAGAASLDVSAARQAMAGARTPREKLAVNRRLSVLLESLMADASRNPRLQSGKAFARWKEEFATCDNQMAVARNRYNRLLQKYNARIQEFPESLVASVAGLRRDNAYFQTGDSVPEAPGH
jgi:LemA protein